MPLKPGVMGLERHDPDHLHLHTWCGHMVLTGTVNSGQSRRMQYAGTWRASHLVLLRLWVKLVVSVDV